MCTASTCFSVGVCSLCLCLKRLTHKAVGLCEKNHLTRTNLSPCSPTVIYVLSVCTKGIGHIKVLIGTILNVSGSMQVMTHCIAMNNSFEITLYYSVINETFVLNILHSCIQQPAHRIDGWIVRCYSIDEPGQHCQPGQSSPWSNVLLLPTSSC